MAGQPPSADWDGASYDRVSAPQLRWGRNVLERLELSGDEVVLDAGCGTGRVTEELVARLPQGHVVALDASPSMLAQAQARLGAARAAGRVSFLHADLRSLSPAALGDRAPLDAVLSTATFHWVTDHDKLFADLRSVLRPGGQLVAQCGGEGNIASVIAAVRSLGVERAGTWLYASPEDTAVRLRRAGFEMTEVWSHPEVATFDGPADLVEFLGTVCLREHLGTLPEEQRRPFAEKVAAAMPAAEVDYVRLNMVARARGAAI
ncbi:MAG TPA: methyltransferase domain-containing protein [Acidimicrobiales bacterium]|nr:methyltransferase domain-containing protein [Acidimicrobiales bacterium]